MPRRILFLSALLSLFAACNSEPAPGNGTAEASGSAPAAADGKAVFQQNCSSCHMLDQDAAGPRLRGALARWNNDTVKLKSFIRNAPALIQAGDPLALQAQQRANGNVMPAFSGLRDDELSQLINYIQNGR
jgi:mono/diheme cytochrome c family protein